MNYRHAFHAGNFADVLKHAVLTRILVHLRGKPAPFRVIDIHAGAGRYDLTVEEAQRSGEWRDGIARLAGASLRAPVRALLAPYLDAFFETAFDDPTLSILFEEVSQMLRPATAMMHPSVVARVLMRRLNPFVRRRPRDPAVLPPAALVFHDLPPRWLERHAGAAVAPSFSES